MPLNVACIPGDKWPGTQVGLLSVVEWIAHPVVPIALAEVTEYLSVGCLVFESIPLESLFAV